MPKQGMEPIRREALIAATIAEIGATGSLDITVSAIAPPGGCLIGAGPSLFRRQGSDLSCDDDTYPRGLWERGARGAKGGNLAPGRG